MGKIEALASLAVIGFENPDWARSTISDRIETVFEAKGLGHPLITLNRAHNDLTVDGKINFDYKLRLGPSTTRNALHLMRLA